MKINYFVAPYRPSNAPWVNRAGLIGSWRKVSIGGVVKRRGSRIASRVQLRIRTVFFVEGGMLVRTRILLCCSCSSLCATRLTLRREPSPCSAMAKKRSQKQTKPKFQLTDFEIGRIVTLDEEGMAGVLSVRRRPAAAGRLRTDETPAILDGGQV